MILYSSVKQVWEYIMKLIDRVGLRYGKLVVVDRAPNKSEADTNARWNCLCDCGKSTVAYGQDLGRGLNKSCGCAAKNRIADYGRQNRTHGMSRTLTYRVWYSMKKRCKNPKDIRFKHYGGRGIIYCERWEKFENFISDMGHPEAGLSLDRINNNGNYEPSNCRWATKREQSNNRRTGVKLTYNDVTLSISEWARALNICVSTFRDRMTAGFADEKLFSPNLKFRN